MHDRFELILIGLMVIGVGGYIVLKARSLIMRPSWVPTPSHVIEISEIPRVLSELLTAKSSPAFAVFMFDELSGDGALNLQFSLENGKAGFDWVLLGRPNKRVAKRYVAFARSSGYEPVLEKLNGVHYWRVERGDLVTLCKDVITKMYNRSDKEPIEMILQGFEWKP